MTKEKIFAGNAKKLPFNSSLTASGEERPPCVWKERLPSLLAPVGPGEGMGNGRATALRFAQEGAKVMAVDRNLSSAEETVSMVKQGGSECFAFEADVTKEATLAAAIPTALKRWGRIDILHYNVDRRCFPRR
jgi:hypothetical protein